MIIIDIQYTEKIKKGHTYIGKFRAWAKLSHGLAMLGSNKIVLPAMPKKSATELSILYYRYMHISYYIYK